ncbi:MAG: hypothetical protein MUC36_12465 [Planctomycetes bacterium]|jgi:hypothetical protein|nr:hypothetical protein [Planctomycetota bacterium]
MRSLLSLLVFGLAVVAPAQSPLVVAPVAPFGYLQWTAAAANPQTFFDLTVSSTITLRQLETTLVSPAGTSGSIEVWLTLPGTTTHVGNEGNAAVWSLAARGTITSGGPSLNFPSRACLEAPLGGGLVLAPGSYGVALRHIGVRPLLIAVGAAQSVATSELAISGGAVQSAAFTSPIAPPATGFSGWFWRGSLFYSNGAVTHACARATAYGLGCYDVCGSFYEFFTAPPPASASPAASAAMSGRRLTLVPTGSGYTLNQSAVAFVPPTAAATVLALGDDSEVQVSLPAPFPYPGGVAPALFVNSNGYVSVASQVALPGGPNWVPELAPFLAAPATAWWSWHDYNPSEPGSGPVVAELVGNRMIITWNGVESYPTWAANPSTWQFQFELNTGLVHYVWQTIDPVGGGSLASVDDHLVGYSPGGPSPLCAPIAITTANGVALLAERFALQLAALTPPILGTTLQLETSQPTGAGVGVNFLSLSQIPSPGVGLGVIGAPGCQALIDLTVSTGNLIGNTAGQSMLASWALPANPAFTGIVLYSQSVWVDPAVNPAGLLTSNGLELQLQ